MSRSVHKTIGVMGGMGPEATVDFMAKLIAMTESDNDQNHIPMIVDHDPSVPDRQVAIRSGHDDVSAHLAGMAQRLEKAGADFLVMVCNTAHAFLGGVRKTSGIPVVSIIDESVNAIERDWPEAKSVGVMATEGCVETRIFQDAIVRSGRTPLLPDKDCNKELMALINAVKAGDKSEAVKRAMRDIADGLKGKGADVLIAGCTEIPIVFSGEGYSLPVVASTDELAKRAVAIATGLVSMPPLDNT